MRSKKEQSEEAGMKSFVHRLPADVREEDLLTLIAGLNRDERVHGILVQLPLPPQIRPDVVLAAIDPDKDVDGFHVVNVGRLSRASPARWCPCTPLGCLRLIKSVRQRSRRTEGDRRRPIEHRRQADGCACCWPKTAR